MATFLNIIQLSKKIDEIRKKKKKVVLCHGVFDLLHVGHIRHFEKAKTLGDILVVSITADKFVNKGPGRPAFKEENRVHAVSSIRDVDFVTINHDYTAINLIKKIRPDIYCKGPDYRKHSNDLTGEIKNEIKHIKRVGGQIIYTGGETFSSSVLINKFSENISSSQKNSINKIKKSYTFNSLNKLIENFKKIKVLVIGETIIDQYVFCDALGKSGKEPVLALREMKSETYLGGALAIARHISKFCKKINLFSMIGEKNEFLKEIKTSSEKNIKLNFINKKDSPTIFKKRFVDYISNNKILGVYNINDDPLNPMDEKKFNNYLKKNLKKYDLVIVSDYGHGFISLKSAKIISENSKYLAVNAQINAANIGYHSMKKYKNINCMVVNEKEVRHELRDRTNDLKILMKRLAREQKIKTVIATKGQNGSIMYNLKENSFVQSDAFAKKVVDKIGSGDSMLALISLCLKSNFSKELSLLIGSLAAAYSTETMANKEPISKIKVLKALEHILK